MSEPLSYATPSPPRQRRRPSSRKVIALALGCAAIGWIAAFVLVSLVVAGVAEPFPELSFWVLAGPAGLVGAIWRPEELTGLCFGIGALHAFYCVLALVTTTRRAVFLTVLGIHIACAVAAWGIVAFIP